MLNFVLFWGIEAEEDFWGNEISAFTPDCIYKGLYEGIAFIIRR